MVMISGWTGGMEESSFMNGTILKSILYRTKLRRTKFSSDKIFRRTKFSSLSQIFVTFVRQKGFKLQACFAMRRVCVVPKWLEEREKDI